MHKFLFAHKNPLSVVLFLLILGGYYAYDHMQSSLFPEITFPKIKIIADGSLQPVDKMMVSVTLPLENAVKQIPGVQSIRSSTSRGSCEISAFIDWKSDVDWSQQRIEAKISEMGNILPPDLSISVQKMNPSILPVMGYILESHDFSPIELNTLAEYTIKPYLSEAWGVAEVRVIGGKTKEFWLLLDAQKMSALSVTPDAITNALDATNFIRSNGYLSDYRYLYLTVTDASVHSVSDLQNIVISNNGNRIIYLKDIASVEVKEAVQYTKINANGRSGILVAIIKQPEANLLAIADEMKWRMEELKYILPEGVTLKPYYNQADFVTQSINSVSDSLWIGILLAIIVAIIFLRSLKASITILIIIPVTLGMTLLVLYYYDYTFNIMTLGAIAAAIGLIIDDAIVVVEQIHRTQEEHPHETKSTAVRNAIHYLFPAMLGSSISTIVIFVPFFLMTGVAGAYFKVMTDTMIITLVCSFFVTWIGLPVIYMILSNYLPILSRFIKGKKYHKTARQLAEEAAIKSAKAHKLLMGKHRPWLTYVINNPILSVVIIIFLALSSYYILPRLQTGFLPEMDEGSIVLDYSSPPGTSLEETDRILRQAEKVITSVPEVETYSRRTGTQMGFFITEPNRGDYLIQLKKKRTRTTAQVIDDIRRRVESSQPSLVIEFGQVIGDMLGDLTSSAKPIEIKVFGNEVEELQKLSRQIAKIVSSVKGTADVKDGIIYSGPSVSILPDYTKLAQFGVTPANLQYQLKTSMEGNTVGSIFDQEQIYNIRIVYPKSRKISVADVNKLQIFLPNGKLKPITELATVEVNQGEAEIQRENLESIEVVTASLNNRDLGSVIKDIQKSISEGVKLPQGYHIEYGGAYKEQQQSFKELLMILIVASMLVFGVIHFLFRNFFVAFIIFTISVLGISGSYLALYITNTPLNVGSYTGLIMIVGILGENAIFTFLQFRAFLQHHSVDEAIIYSISTRLRPKLMTAIGAIIALLPLGLGIGSGAALHQPLAIAVIGGFIIGLPLLLIVLPSLLRLLYRNYVPAIPEEHHEI